MNKKKLIKENWGKESIFELMESHQISIDEFLKIAYELKLYNKETPNIARRWTKAEEDFLIHHADDITIKQASRLFYRSYYATYQRVRLLGLGDKMINKK